jgi:hypothetical protein
MQVSIALSREHHNQTGTEDSVVRTHISIGISIKTSRIGTLHNVDPFASVVALVEMSDAGSKETGHCNRWHFPYEIALII